MKENDGILTHIKLPEILPEIFQIILRYIYGGKLILEEYDISDIIKIMEAASKLSLQELIDYLQSYLIEKKTNWIEQNFNMIYHASFENNSFLKLQEYCTNLISDEPDKIFKSLNFFSIPEKLLISIIQNDNLQMSEVQVWEHVLKWGLAQNSELPSEPTSFSVDDFNTLKNILQQLIPFIRFYNLTSKEFSDKVLPYMKILPEDLCMDLLKTFLNLSDPNSKPDDKSKPRKTKKINLKTIDSKIITYQHAELILKWVNRLEITDELTTSHEFELLFRGSRDGSEPKKFHQFCDGKSHTITVAKVEDSNEILGGYNPIAWNSDCDRNTTKDSFIFSFENNNGIDNHILSHVVNEQWAIYNHDSCGPLFGRSDLYFWNFESSRNGNSMSIKDSYDKSIRKSKDLFFIEELEVFQIIKT
ncbi:carbohydrate-binding module family 13 protein [Rhizophagus clarus]|nr:carbohydrate-binding module family 13 protein [Rhizophagus clarus]